MGIGNKNSDGKNIDFSYRLKLLKGLDSISNNTSDLGNANSLLAQIRDAVMAHQEFELKLVRDTGNGNIVVQRNEYDEQTQTWVLSYVDVNGAAYVPVGPLEYLDGSASLNLILAELLDQGLTLDNIDLKLTPAIRTHNTISSTGVGSVPAGSLRGSVINLGNQPGIWNGVSLPAGMTIPWGDAGSRDTYNAIEYDATDTNFIIEYTT